MGEKDDDDWDFDPEEPEDSDDELSAEAFEFMTNDEPGAQPLNETIHPGILDDLALDTEEYKEGARQYDKTEASDAPENESKSRAKAARIVSDLDVKDSDRDIVLNDLTRFFKQRSHAATFRAICRLVDSKNMSWGFLKSIIELREHWENNRNYWKIRRWGEIIEHERGRSQMTWGAARDICEARPDHHPNHMIDDDWMRDWYNLQPGDYGYFDFVSYVRERVRNREGNELAEGFRMRGDEYNA